MANSRSSEPLALYKPLPWQKEPWADTSDILLLTGSAGGGKSRLAAEKIHGYCMRYPGATALVMRKVRATMANSTVLFFKNEVIGRDPNVRHRPSEFRFEYSNGSILAYGGMKDDDQRERIRSIGQKGGLDICWMEEATEFEEQDFNEIVARMRGTAAPWRQIILTTNPDGPQHWINRRLILGGGASVYFSRAQDNPHNAGDYQSKLETLTGVQYERLVLGKWVAASNMVFDTWADEGHSKSPNVTAAADYEHGAGPVMWAVDDGYSGDLDEATGMYTGKSHPRVILWIQRRPDGTLVLFRESYEIEMLAEEHVNRELGVGRRHGLPRPAYAVRDRAAAHLGGVLESVGLRVRYSTVPVEESLKEMHRWVSPDRNERRRLLVNPRCTNFRYEMGSYARTNDGSIIKQHDNGPDAMRYFIWDETYGAPGIVDFATANMPMLDLQSMEQEYPDFDVATIGSKWTRKARTDAIRQVDSGAI